MKQETTSKLQAMLESARKKDPVMIGDGNIQSCYISVADLHPALRLAIERNGLCSRSD